MAAAVALATQKKTPMSVSKSPVHRLDLCGHPQ